MSIEYLNKAFRSNISPSSLKFVLVALADFANELGEAYPSVETLCNKTNQNRKTIMANIKKLVLAGIIVDTGERKGKTKQVIVYRIARVPKTALLKSPKNGTGKSPKNGTIKESQKRDTEPSVLFNHQLEPSEEKKKRNTPLASRKKPSLSGIEKAKQEIIQETGCTKEILDSICQHRVDIGKRITTKKPLLMIFNGMVKTVKLGYAESVIDCLDFYVNETTWQQFKPEWYKNSHSKITKTKAVGGDYGKTPVFDENPTFRL